MASLSDEIREIADHLRRLAVNARCGINAHRLFDIADRLEGKVLVKPEIDVCGFGTYLASVDEDGMHRHPYGTGLTLPAAIAALQAKLDQQESTPTPPE